MTSDPLWYRDAIIYELHIKAYFDANDDGVGDFRGLTQKLDYLQDLGVTALWLLPFYPSPQRDDGYDIADYLDVNRAYGTIADFRTLVREAHKRDLKVITELVMNHTSDQHPWFQRARQAKPGSSHRDYYVWSDSDQKYAGTRIIFTDTESSNWAWDPVAKAYYWHRFFSHQPDLNFDNPAVIRSVNKVMSFWLELGVDGLRLDAVPYLVEREGANNENLPETHAILRQLRAWLDQNFEGRMFLAEANQWPEDVLPYFGNGDECHMAFHFPLMPRIYMALAQEDRHPIADIMRQTPEIPANCQWAIFLRNHDELTLEMVTDRERDYLWQFYAAERQARINVGIRRRLAPLLENDRRKIELLNSLLVSMPGTPVLYYGDEIGMGDNIFLGDRNGVRTPMQWSPDRNGGFSRADPARLYSPAIMDPVYGYQSVNVEAQQRNPSSLLNWTRRLIAMRKAYHAFGRGSLSFLYPGNRKVLAYLRQYGAETMLCVANLSRATQPVELDLSGFKGRVPVEILGGTALPPIGELPYFITLPPYGFFWFLLREEAEAPAWLEALRGGRREVVTLVLARGANSLLENEPKRSFELAVLPEFVAQQRWFAGKGKRMEAVQLVDLAEIQASGRTWALTFLEVALAGDGSQHYFLPLTLAFGPEAEDPASVLQPQVLARTRKGSRIGLLIDATYDEQFVAALLAAMAGDQRTPTSLGGEIIFIGSDRLRAQLPVDGSVQRLGREQSNTSLSLGDAVMLKILRRIAPGMHPELEVNRFLTEVGFRNTPAFLGAVELAQSDGVWALAVLQARVQNQGDGWTWTMDHLRRVLDEAQMMAAPQEAGADPHGIYGALITTLGQRLAEMHHAFATTVEDPAFAPEPVSSSDLQRWSGDARAQGRAALAALEACRDWISPELKGEADNLLSDWAVVEQRIGGSVPTNGSFLKTRLHGDFHLGQVLLCKDDFVIIDFEGEPARPIEERRAKHCILKDVAGILRSFDYAAAASIADRLELQPQGREAVVRAANAWQQLAHTRFLDGYRGAVRGLASYPAAEDAERLLQLFIMDKVLYEIAYEGANRPSWINIPLNGLLRLLGRLA
ncbi:MAG TPA: maltose alpha-D-glucosyltransferase [Alphaproteobacteria bacterium]|nr:maltose alpha-D-glucosyltransferase [Alphaproteobacteria bacterium]